MKLSIRFADKIVGTLVVLAVGILIFVIFMLGSSQRWFSRDYNFKTYFQSASGLSQNMPILYKGFTIGRVRSIQLAEDDRVEVDFTIFDTYIDRVRGGSLVEVVVSPLGALGGSQFLFHPGAGKDLLNEGEIIPAINADKTDDGIATIVSTVGDLLSTLDEAFKGTDTSSLGRTIGDLEGVVAELRKVLEILPAELDPILVNLHELSDQLVEPGGTIPSILDSEGDVYRDLVKSLNGLAGILENLDTTTAFLPGQLPQIAGLIADLRVTLTTVEDVLISVTNNPLLKRGVPERKETNVGGAYTRDLEF